MSFKCKCFALGWSAGGGRGLGQSSKNNDKVMGGTQKNIQRLLVWHLHNKLRRPLGRDPCHMLCIRVG